MAEEGLDASDDNNSSDKGVSCDVRPSPDATQPLGPAAYLFGLTEVGILP